jgi:L-methionine (R)-S-oxide reductase
MRRELVDRVRRESARDGSRTDRAKRVAELIRAATGRRWVGIYAVTSDEVANLAWSGPSPPTYPTFPASQGLTGVAIGHRSTVVSNDVSNDPRYLTALESTGSEMIVPVIVEDRVVGTVDVEDERLGAFSSQDEKLFEEIAAALRPLYA